MIVPITYDQYHAEFADHLMGDVDTITDERVIEIEYFDRDVEWFKTNGAFSLKELDMTLIRCITIS